MVAVMSSANIQASCSKSAEKFLKWKNDDERCMEPRQKVQSFCRSNPNFIKSVPLYAKEIWSKTLGTPDLDNDIFFNDYFFIFSGSQ